MFRIKVSQKLSFNFENKLTVAGIAPASELCRVSLWGLMGRFNAIFQRCSPRGEGSLYCTDRSGFCTRIPAWISCLCFMDVWVRRHGQLRRARGNVAWINDAPFEHSPRNQSAQRSQGDSQYFCSAMLSVTSPRNMLCFIKSKQCLRDESIYKITGASHFADRTKPACRACAPGSKAGRNTNKAFTGSKLNQTCHEISVSNAILVHDEQGFLTTWRIRHICYIPYHL